MAHASSWLLARIAGAGLRLRQRHREPSGHARCCTLGMTQENQDTRQSDLGFDRVRAHTAPMVNVRIDRQTDGALRQARSSREHATARLAELDREWDIDRALMAFAGTVGGAAFLAGLFRNRKWFLLVGPQLAFLIAHAAIGWCPPVALFRRLGFRTRQEIDSERQALHAAPSLPA
ncbi:DUF2892 domain-containing protein [Pendulispora brunnea]|uniref:DUF2892 domain-containing protein n=1 Tax=Pendulispora brunnea TaxID=2905690 RepID=A0ABZ2KGN2_9BACT